MSTTDIATETTIHRTVPGSHTGYAPSPSPFERARGVSQAPVLIGSFSGRGVRQYLAAEAAAMFVSMGSTRPMSPYQLRGLTSRTDRSRRSELSEQHSRETRSHARHHRVPLA